MCIYFYHMYTHINTYSLLSSFSLLWNIFLNRQKFLDAVKPHSEDGSVSLLAPDHLALEGYMYKK